MELSNCGFKFKILKDPASGILTHIWIPQKELNMEIMF